MRTPQLISATLLAAALATAGCNRAQTDQQTQRAAAEVKTAAARAGDALQDGWLTTRIQAQYFADKQVKGRYVDVSTKDRVVTIKGYVDSPASRERAVQIARATDGVKQVNDQLLIGQSPKAFEATEHPVATSGTLSSSTAVTTKPDDDQVTSSIQSKYFLDTMVKGRNIAVDTHAGVVTLKGEVASEDERAKALLLARTTDGVDRVEDNLTVNAAIDQPVATSESVTAAPARADDDAVQSAVAAKFGADPQMKKVDISAKDGVVMLQGTVPNVAAKRRALAAARQADGVSQVVDRLKIGR